VAYLGDYKALRRTIFGQKMYIDTRDLIVAPNLLLDGYWEIWVTKAIRRELKQGMNVVEIGSNIGYYSLIIASRIGPSGKLFAFEANPDTFKILRDNIDMNGFSSMVKLEKKAVIDRTGMVNFTKLSRHGAASSVLEFPKSAEADIIEVKATSLDEYFKNSEIKIDIMKIDAEGSEPHIFEGMKKLIHNNPDLTIICEFNPPLLSYTMDPSKFLEKLQSDGFILKYIDTDSIPKEASIDKLAKMGVIDLYLRRTNVSR
jgi:FkbM family methyltransferase